MVTNMTETERIQQIAQLRKAIMPLVELLKTDANKELESRLEIIEKSLQSLAEKEVKFDVQVNAPDVTFEVPTELTQAITDIHKMVEINMKKNNDVVVKDTSHYEPLDQAKEKVFTYSGFMKSDGSWKIQRIAKNEQRYAFGKGDYADAWKRKSKLDYGYADGGK